MIVCHCRSATDREIRRAIRDGATTLREVSAQCGAGSCCGGCVAAVVEIITVELGTAPRAVDCDRTPAQS